MLLYQVPQNIKQFINEIHRKYVDRPRLIAFYKATYGDYTLANTIKYLKLPRQIDYPLDLNEGYEKHTFLKSFLHNTYLSLVLHWAISPDGIEFTNNCSEKTIVYSRCGILCCLMLWPWKLPHISNNATIRVSRYNGDLYICNHFVHIDGKTGKRNFHHNRLLQLLFADSADEYPNTETATDSNIQDLGLYRTTLGKYELLYSGELPGIEKDINIENLDDIDELNECTFVQSKQMWNTLPRDHKRLKKMSWWSYAYLANVEKIYIATKQNDGKVYEPIEMVEVSKMPLANQFTPGHLVGFLYKTLQMIENVMADVNSLETTYEFNIDTISKQITYSAYPGYTDKTFIDAKYILRKTRCI